MADDTYGAMQQGDLSDVSTLYSVAAVPWFRELQPRSIYRTCCPAQHCSFPQAGRPGCQPFPKRCKSNIPPDQTSFQIRNVPVFL